MMYIFIYTVYFKHKSVFVFVTFVYNITSYQHVKMTSMLLSITDIFPLQAN